MSTTSEKSEKTISVPEPSLPLSPLKISKKEVWVMKEMAMDMVKDLKVVPGPFELALLAMDRYMQTRGWVVLDMGPLLRDYVENSEQYTVTEE